MPQQFDPTEDNKSRQALLLTFAFDGQKLQLLFEEPVDMTVFPSSDLTRDIPAAGFRYELQAADGSTLYRRFARNPVDPWVEVLTEEGRTQLVYRMTKSREGTFALAVPDLPRAHSVVLLQSPPSEAVPAPEAPTEIARFTLANAIDPKGAAEDSIPPTTSADVLGSYVGSAEIHLIALDNAGGSGVAHTYYRLDGGVEQEGVTVSVNRTGDHTLQFWSIDNAGNRERKHRVAFSIVPFRDIGAG